MLITVYGTYRPLCDAIAETMQRLFKPKDVQAVIHSDISPNFVKTRIAVLADLRFSAEGVEKEAIDKFVSRIVETVDGDLSRVIVLSKELGCPLPDVLSGISQGHVLETTDIEGVIRLVKSLLGN